MRMTQAIPALPVREINAAVKFYQDNLGFDPFYQESGFARLRRSDIEIQLWEASDESWKGRSAEIPFTGAVSGAESFLAGTASCRIEVQGIEHLMG